MQTLNSNGSPVTDSRTPRGYPIPDVDNDVSIDCFRLADSIRRISDDLDSMDSRYLGLAIFVRDINIPSTGWIANTDPVEAPDLYHVDIPIEGLLDTWTPDVTFHPTSEIIAAAAGISAVARTLTGFLRLYAKNIPTEPMTATLKLTSTDNRENNIATEADLEDMFKDNVTGGAGIATLDDLMAMFQD